MMNVAVILPSLANKAPIQVAKDLTAKMVLSGINVCVYYFDDVVEVDFSCKTERISFFKNIDFDGFDIIHSHMLRPDAYVWYRRLLDSCKKTGFVSTIHNIVEEDLCFNYGGFRAYVFSRLWRVFWSAQDELIVLNNSAQKYYFNFLKRRKTNVIYNGRALTTSAYIEEEDECLLNKLRSEFHVLGACAVLTRRKGLDQIIRILPARKEYALVVVGDGPARTELKNLAIELGVSDRCKFLGYRANAQSFLAQFDIYVMPSRSEGLPLALLEAAGNKLPVVCSDIEVFKEIFTDKEVSFFELQNELDLIKALDSCLKNKTTLAFNIYKKYTERFTDEFMAKRYIELFLRLIKIKSEECSG